MEERRNIRPDEKTVVISPVNQPGKKKKKTDKIPVNVGLYTDSQFHIPVRNVQVCANQIIGSRKSQQDMFATSKSIIDLANENTRVWAVVCDGMGGMAAGEEASRIASEVLSQILDSALPQDSIPDVLAQAVGIANEEVKKLSEQKYELTGTTLVCAVINNDDLYYASVGDSRIYIYRNNEFMQITRDHNYMLELAEMVTSGVMTMEDAMLDPQKEALISYIGIDELKLVDINRTALKLQDGDIILLCSDGLYKAIEDEEIHNTIDENRNNIGEMVDALLRDVQIGISKGLDNTTIAVMKYNNY